MDYATNSNTDATRPVEAGTPATSGPSPVDDLAKRIAVLKENGVREYADGPIHILFERPQSKQEEDPVSKAIRDYEESMGAIG